MKQNATAKRENLRQELIYNTTPGEVRLFEGDVVQLDGGPHIVTKSNHAGATCVPLQGRNVGGETLGGKKFAFVQPGRTQHISGCVPKYLVLERRGDEGLAAFLENNKKSSRPVPQPEGAEQSGETTTEREEVVMARTKKPAATKKSVADKTVAKTVKTQTVKTTTGERVRAEIFGFSVGAVLRRLGKEGVSKEDAAKILVAKGIKSSPITISVNIDSGSGGFNRGEPAALTGEQVKQLKALIKA